jgi:hypothetical protein
LPDLSRNTNGKYERVDRKILIPHCAGEINGTIHKLLMFHPQKIKH